MEEKDMFKDDFIKSAIQTSQRRLPNDAFEDETMLRIEAEIMYKSEVSIQLKKSLRFFTSALLTGIFLIVFILLGNISSFYSSKTIFIVALLAIAIMGVLNFDNYRRLIRKYSP